MKINSHLIPLSFHDCVSLLVDNAYYMEIIIRHNKTVYIRYSDTMSHTAYQHDILQF